MSLESILVELSKKINALQTKVADHDRRIIRAPFHADSSKVLGIVGGSIEATRPYIHLVPETGITGTLNTITNGSDGKMVIIANSRVGDTITVNPYTVAAGNIDFKGLVSPYILDDVHDSIVLIYRESTAHWEQIGTNGTGPEISEAPEDTPLDADKFVFWDVVDSLLKSITWANLKALLKTYFDTLYSVTSHLHDDRYSLLAHLHDDRYSLLAHLHDDRYSLLAHLHDDRYSLLAHDHAGVYSLIGHTHSSTLILGTPQTATIAAGAITVTSSNVIVLPETGTADNLDTINGGADGQRLVLATAADGDTITITSYIVSGGNIDMRGAGGGRILADRHDSVELIWRTATGHWEQISPVWLDHLVGVVVTSPTDGQVLSYDLASGNWIPADIVPGTTDVEAVIDAAADQTTIVDATKFATIDGDVLKTSLWPLLKSTLKTYLDTLYAALVHTHHTTGTWSPVISSSSPGTMSVSYTIQDGRWTKIGGVVFFTFFIRINGFTLGTGTGEVQISLPSAASVTNAYTYVGGISTNGVDWPGTPINAAFEVAAGTNYGRLVAVQDNATRLYVSPSALAAVDDITAAGFYME